MKALFIVTILLSSAFAHADFVDDSGPSKSLIVNKFRSCGLFELNYYGQQDGSVSITIYPNPKDSHRYTMSTLSREVADAINRDANCLCAEVEETFEGSPLTRKSTYYRFKIKPAKNLSYNCPARELRAANNYRR